MKARLLAGLVALGALGSAWAAQVPRPAPEFVIQTPDGKQLLLSQLRGKVVVLEFLFTTCPHCQACSETMQKVYNDLGSRGMIAVGAAFNENAQVLVPDYIRQLRLTFPVGVAVSGRDAVMDFLQFPRTERFVVPQLVIIDKKGQIRLQATGGDDFFKNEEANMRAEVENLLKEPAAARRRGAAGVQKARPH